MPAAFKVGDVFDRVRSLMNDQSGDVYTDFVITPYFKMAHDDLRQECEDNNIPYTNITSAGITIQQGVTDIGGETGPALPLDLVEILEMYERVSGSNNDYLLMKRNLFLPKVETITSYLEVYTWQKQIIRFLGANGNVEVKIDYLGDTLGEVVNENTVINLFNAKPFLSFRSAAYCANYIGENPDRADRLDLNAVRSLETFLNIAIKNEQSMPVRRRPFMSTYRQRGWSGFQG